MNANPRIRTPLTVLLSLTAGTILGVSGFICPAHAGFTWMPPAKSAGASPERGEPALSRAHAQLVPDNSLSFAPASPRTAERRDDSAPASSSAPLIPVLLEALPRITDNDRSAVTANVAGFGVDIPLANALSEIVPPGYAYSFGPGVDPRTIVSWRGDRAWEVVLEEAIGPIGLTAKIGNNGVRVERLAASPLAADGFARMPAPGALAPHYSDCQLAEIGAVTAIGHLSYPRRQPRQYADVTAEASGRWSAACRYPGLEGFLNASLTGIPCVPFDP